ncbi:hypothetical protein I4U23_026773 [Adineta vaga]|nr:hypothetical protein I4U23_026773 [Adineta vaga]
MDETTSRVSDFYVACRTNNRELVLELLNSCPLEDLDRMEANNSTPLHAASYHNCTGIVQLLLSSGFTRCVRNRFGKTPYEEIHDENKDLFDRYKGTNRFGGRIYFEEEKLIWIQSDGNQQTISRDFYNGDYLKFELFREDEICQQLHDMPQLDVIRRYFRHAIEAKNAIYFIQAYTAETYFYKRINEYLLKRDQYRSESFSKFVQTIAFNRELHTRYSYEGLCYRSICTYSNEILTLFERGKKISNRMFLSTIQDRTLAENYIQERKTAEQYVIMMIFKIRHRYTALDIEQISEFPHEKEILIMYDSIFEVTQIIEKNQLEFEIRLSEIKSNYR